jgi:hypothetical protein
MSKGWRGDSARHSLAAKGMKTKRNIPHKSAKLDKTAFDVGARLQRASESYKNYIIFEDNLRGLVSDMEVPYSEVAMHTGAAGGKIVAIVGSVKDGRMNGAMVAYKKEDRYGYVEGLPDEVMAPETLRIVKELYGVK